MPKMQYDGAQVPNQFGVYKKFKNPYGAEANSWRRSYQEADKFIFIAKPKRAKMTDAEKAKRREDKRIEKNKLEIDIYNQIENAFGAGFEGCDPIDFLYPVMRKYKLEMKDIDRLWKKWGRTKKGFYESLAESWDDMQGDRIHDAKSGHIDDNSQFYRVIKEEIIPSDNPWR